jgi:hypothetical protein
MTTENSQYPNAGFNVSGRQQIITGPDQSPPDLNAGLQENMRLNSKGDLFDKSVALQMKLISKPGDEVMWLKLEITKRVYQMAQEIEVERLKKAIEEQIEKIEDIKHEIEHRKFLDEAHMEAHKEHLLEIKDKQRRGEI